MSHQPRRTTILPPSTTSSTRQPSASSLHNPSNQSSALSSRIASKRAELENLKQLRDLSGALANQMGVLEAKLATLRDGTEAVACVMANWGQVMRAIGMASSEYYSYSRKLRFVGLMCGVFVSSESTYAEDDGRGGRGEEEGG
jgi:DASH complex subunit DAD2